MAKLSRNLKTALAYATFGDVTMYDAVLDLTEDGHGLDDWAAAVIQAINSADPVEFISRMQSWFGPGRGAAFRGPAPERADGEPVTTVRILVDGTLLIVDFHDARPERYVSVYAVEAQALGFEGERWAFAILAGKLRRC